MKAVAFPDSPQVAEITMSYKTKVSDKNKPYVNSSLDAYLLLKSVWNEDHIEFIEEFRILLLNRRQRVIASYMVGQGGCEGVYVDLKLIFKAALVTNASSIILSHNHPSGNLQPSEQDKLLTKDIVQLGKMLRLPIFDHIIVTVDSYYSFADSGLI